MWIKGIIVHPELILKCSQDEYDELRKFLLDNNLQLFGFSNRNLNKYKQATEDIGGVFISKVDVGKNKGSPEWIHYIEKRFGITHNELVYIGYGNRKHDWYTAINSSVFYLHYAPEKKVSKDISKYVLRTASVQGALKFINVFLRDPPLFTYEFTFEDGTELRILFDAGVELKDVNGESFSLRDLFTYDKIFLLGKKRKIDARSILFLLLIAQLWKEGIASRGVRWCVYPSSKKGRVSKNMEPYLRFFRGLTGSYYAQILKRCKNTVDKSKARKEGRYHEVSFDREKGSLCLDEKQSIKGRRIIVVDDFSTTGMSLEAAKLLLRNAGASQIALCAVGKYGSNHTVYDVEGNISCNVRLYQNLGAQERLKEIINECNDLF